MKTFIIYKTTQTPDGKGGFIENSIKESQIEGYIDMLSGSNETSSINNAFIEKSTHIIITKDITTLITDKHTIVDSYGREYEVTYVDNPVDLSHHREIYLKYMGV